MPTSVGIIADGPAVINEQHAAGCLSPLAGGGVKPGQVIGATDAVGLRAAANVSHVHDVHA